MLFSRGAPRFSIANEEAEVERSVEVVSAAEEEEGATVREGDEASVDMARSGGRSGATRELAELCGRAGSWGTEEQGTEDARKFKSQV